MNAPKDYNNKAEHLRTHPLLLPKEDDPGIVISADKAVLKKTNDKISFSPRVSLAKKTPIGTKKKSMPQ